MMCLADGKREDAQRHFEACVAMDARGWFDYEWARGYLALMDSDRSWPSSQPDRVD